MINWVYVGWNALWIAGLSVVFTTISIAAYQSSERNQKLREILFGKGFRLVFDLGMVLFVLGWFGLAGAWWERVLWGILCAGFVFDLGRFIRKKPLPDHA